MKKGRNYNLIYKQNKKDAIKDAMKKIKDAMKINTTNKDILYLMKFDRRGEQIGRFSKLWRLPGILFYKNQ